jgi:molecular chaperone DnaJ
MAEKRDYYEVLGVPKGSNQDQIKDSYRKLAMQFHPDRNKSPEAEEKFKEISEAYAVLSDDQKRQQYDNLGHSGFDQKYTEEDIFRGADFNSVFRDSGFDFGDVFRQFFGGGSFGGGGYSERTNRGQDLLYDLNITLEEAAKGTEKEIEIPRTEKCDVCGGSGAAPGSQARTCSRCNGQGRIQNTRRSAFGMFVQVVACPECRGKGKIIESACRNCRGSGLVRKRRKITVKVPLGIDEGYQLRLRGEGENVADDGEPGDLYVLVHIVPHKLFMREDNDLYYTLIIGYPQAVLGAEVQVPTLDGPTVLRIDQGTQVGQVIRMKGKGMPRFKGYGKGDLLIRIGISIPEKITTQQRRLLEQLSKEFGEDSIGKERKFKF